MKYGYARVSTTDQKLANQIELLKLAGAEKIFQEKFTGTTTERGSNERFNRNLRYSCPKGACLEHVSAPKFTTMLL